MALNKEIKQDDGIITSYHRILFVQSTINSHISIAVLSYVDESSRMYETASNIPYTKTITYEKDYEENMTIKNAYNYLKTLPEFEEATDI